MSDLTLARAIHVVSIVAWIGGVYMVTMIVLPLVRGQATLEDKIKIFHGIENRFSFHARIVTVLAGLSGFYMVYALDAWSRYASMEFWWMHAMTAIWALLTIVLFVLEPFVLHKVFHKRVHENPDKTFKLIGRVHYVLLTASIVTIIGAISGVHG
jgi:uncharacterized membrane protein